MRKLNENRLRKGVVDMGGVASAPTYFELVRSIAVFMSTVERFFLLFSGEVQTCVCIW